MCSKTFLIFKEVLILIGEILMNPRNAKVSFVIAAFFALVIGVLPVFAGSTIISGNISSTDISFTHPDEGSNCTAFDFAPARVDIHTFSVNVTGSYRLEILTGGTQTDTVLILYFGTVNLANGLDHCMDEDDDSGAGFLSLLNANLVAGTTYSIVVAPFDNNVPGSYRLEIAGPGEICVPSCIIDAPFTDGRLNNRDQWATFAVYCDASDITVYAIDSTGVGQVAFVATSEEVAAVPQFPAQNTVIDSGRDVTLYRVQTGELQIVGPRDAEGKVYNMMFLGCPSVPQDMRTWVGN
jgi:hypothetical protein